MIGDDKRQLQIRFLEDMISDEHLFPDDSHLAARLKGFGSVLGIPIPERFADVQPELDTSALREQLTIETD